MQHIASFVFGARGQVPSTGLQNMSCLRKAEDDVDDLHLVEALAAKNRAWSINVPGLGEVFRITEKQVVVADYI